MGGVSNKGVLHPHFSLHSINYLSDDLNYIKMNRFCWIQMTDGDDFSWNALGSCAASEEYLGGPLGCLRAL